MKRSIFTIFFFMIIALGANEPYLSKEPTNPKAIPTSPQVPIKAPISTPPPRAVVVLDPGHGGKEEGAKGWATKVKEKDITLAIAKSAQGWLSQHQVKVYLTRISDYQLANDLKTDLRLRAAFAIQPQIQAALFVSIHIDQYNRKIHGTKVYYSKENPYPEASKQLAQTIHDSLVQEVQSNPLKVHFNDFLVLKENPKPAVLVEVGHLSHPQEEQKLIQPDYQKQAGIGIAKGILTYLNLKPEAD